jgi:hypothetical protein
LGESRLIDVELDAAMKLDATEVVVQSSSTTWISAA